MKSLIFLIITVTVSFADLKDTLKDLEASHDTYQKTLEKFEIEYKQIMNLKISNSFENSIMISTTDKIIKSIFYKEDENVYHQKGIKK